MTDLDFRRNAGRTEVLKALAHPSRLFMLEQLAERDHCVRELTRLVQADVSTVSKHLNVLRGAGPVESEKRGTSVYYRLAAPGVFPFLDSVGAVAAKSQEIREEVSGMRQV